MLQAQRWLVGSKSVGAAETGNQRTRGRHLLGKPRLRLRGFGEAARVWGGREGLGSADGLRGGVEARVNKRGRASVVARGGESRYV